MPEPFTAQDCEEVEDGDLVKEMIRPSKEELRALFQLLEEHASADGVGSGSRSDLRPTCRWLVLGPEMAQTILPEFARRPVLEDLVDLMRLLLSKAPHLRDAGYWLIGASKLAPTVMLELQMDEMLAKPATTWTHPVQVLTKPRSDYRELLDLCRKKLETAEGDRYQLLVSIESKMARAVEIEERAHRRRIERRRREELKSLEADDPDA